MMKDTFPFGMSKSNAFALFKRINVYLNTKNYIYRRLAGKDNNVERFAIESNLITAEAGKIQDDFKKYGYKRAESEERMMIEEERAVMKSYLAAPGLKRQASSTLLSESSAKKPCLLVGEEGVSSLPPQLLRSAKSGPSEVRVVGGRGEDRADTDIIEDGNFMEEFEAAMDLHGVPDQ
jgi:hypothetical protein